MVVENLVCCFVAKNEIITKLDQACPGMFFLMTGKACMEFPRQDVNLVGNDCFGEQALFSGIENVKPTTVKATEHCELLVLEKRKFAAILEHLPELRYTLSELANDIHNNKTKQFMDKHKYIDVAQVKSRQEIDAEQSLAKKIRDKAFQCSRAVAPIILIIYIYLLPFQAAFLIHWEISYTSILFDIVAYLIISVDSI
jgi:CRP-like cAMP-binding protein